MEQKTRKKGILSEILTLLFRSERRRLREGLSVGLFALSLFCLDFFFRAIYFHVDTSPLGDELPLLFTLLWIGLFCGIDFLLPLLARRIFRIAVASIHGLLLLVHACFYSLFGNFFHLSSVIFAGEGAGFFDWSYFTIPKKLIALILIGIALAVLSALMLPKTVYGRLRVLSSCGVIVLTLLGIALGPSLLLPGDAGTMTWDGEAGAMPPADIYETFTDTCKNLHMVGLYQYTFRDFCVFTGLDSLFGSVSVGELDAYYEGKEADPDNEMTGIFKGKNLILIQMESVDTWMVSEAAMPFFSSLWEKGISFPNFYTPKFLSTAATFNTEILVNTGIVPPQNASFAHFSENEYPFSLGRLFGEAGYAVESYHRSNPNIYSRGKVHTNWGYETYNTGAMMGMDNVDFDTDLMDGYEDFVKSEPFVSFLITYSGHGPYGADSPFVERHEKTVRAALPEGVEDEYVYALCHVYETDLFLRALYERLEEEGRLEDTVLVFYSDHYDHYLTNKTLLSELKGSSDQNEMANVPFLIYWEGMEAQRVEKTVASYDILPTLVNLFGLECDGRYFFGNDAFSENGGYVVFSDGSWLDSEVYFNVSSSEPTELSRERAEEIRRRLLMTREAVRTNYFARVKAK